jgi:hypothetical protein
MSFSVAISLYCINTDIPALQLDFTQHNIIVYGWRTVFTGIISWWYQWKMSSGTLHGTKSQMTSFNIFHYFIWMLYLVLKSWSYGTTVKSNEFVGISTLSCMANFKLPTEKSKKIMKTLKINIYVQKYSYEPCCKTIGWSRGNDLGLYSACAWLKSQRRHWILRLMF